jgi:hypothetical protein
MHTHTHTYTHIHTCLAGHGQHSCIYGSHSGQQRYVANASLCTCACQHEYCFGYRQLSLSSTSRYVASASLCTCACQGDYWYGYRQLSLKSTIICMLSNNVLAVLFMLYTYLRLCVCECVCVCMYVCMLCMHVCIRMCGQGC